MLSCNLEFTECIDIPRLGVVSSDAAIKKTCTEHLMLITSDTVDGVAELGLRCERSLCQSTSAQTAKSLGQASRKPQLLGSLMTLYQTALRELAVVFEHLNDVEVERLLDAIIAANRIVVFGGGRERLQIMGFAMRLYHMGLNVAVEGDMTTPPVGPGDLFLVTCGPGSISTGLALMGVAHEARSSVALITAQPKGKGAALSDLVVTLPAQTMADDLGEKKSSVLPMGSLFEGALFVLFEVLVLKLKERLDIDADAMRARHTNLE
jgi:6-phospho-3-hexuloisomerase